jgi:hypothetical protein
MTRYQALRSLGCGPFAAGFIAFCNWLAGYPPNLIVFLTVQIDIGDVQGATE